MPLLSNTAATTNLYAQSDALTAAQAEVLLIAALVLFVVGALLIEGKMLSRAYHAFIRLIGVRRSGAVEAQPQPRPW